MSLITWNPNDKGDSVTLSNNDFTAKLDGVYSGVRATEGKANGKFYFEFTLDEVVYPVIGVCNKNAPKEWVYNGVYGDNARLYSFDGMKYPGGIDYGIPYTIGSIIGVALDLDNGILEFFNNSIPQGIAFTDLIKSTKPIYPYIVHSGSRFSSTITANFGAIPFYISKYAKDMWGQLIKKGYKPYDLENANWDWKKLYNSKYLINQDNNYYSTKSNFINLGKPIDNTQLENWYNKYGSDDVNIITENLNNKEFPMSKDENGIWKTDFELDMNDVTDNIDLVDIDENNKSIKYDCNDYRILDLCDDEFDIRMLREK
ncbi:SPRY domain-containing protein [Clostridium botulinum]|uniref:SPRY domain-containing protein n=1 Tax=Clostridium botulinum TaxID=1491 RepID=UPI003DA32776